MGVERQKMMRIDRYMRPKWEGWGKCQYHQRGRRDNIRTAMEEVEVEEDEIDEVEAAEVEKYYAEAE